MPTLNPQGSVIQLNLNAGGAATIVPLTGGGFAAVYKVRGGADVFRLFDDTYTPITGEVSITSQDNIIPTAITLSDGRFLVAWVQPDRTIHASIWNANGTLSVSPFLAGTASDLTFGLSVPRIVKGPDGGFILTWQDNGTVEGVIKPLVIQAFTASGVAAGTPSLVAAPTVTGAADVSINDFQVAKLAGGGSVIVAQIVADGNTSIWYSKNGAAFVMVAGSETQYTYINPQVAALTGGGFVVTYDFVNPANVGTTNPDSNWTTGGTVYTDHNTHHDFAIGTTITTTRNGDFAVNPSVITALADGGFVVSFEPLQSPLGDGYLVDTQRFDSFGQAIGPVVLTTPQGFQPGIATATNNAVLTTFQYGDNIYLQAYDPSGISFSLEPAGSSFGFNSVVSANSPGVSVLSNGGYVIVYQESTSWLTFLGIDYGGNTKAYAQIYDASRNPVGNTFRVADNAKQPVVAAQSDGTFLVTWVVGNKIKATLYNNDGSVARRAFDLVTGSSDHALLNPGVAATSDGGYLLAYETNVGDTLGSHQLTIQRLDGTGHLLGTALSQTYAPTNPLTPPRIAALEQLLFGTAAVLGAGNTIFVNIFTGNTILTGSAGIDGQPGAQSFTAGAGVAATSQFQVSGGEDGTIRRSSEIISLHDGDIVVAWDEKSPTDATWRVVGQVMTPAGQVRGTPFTIVSALPANSDPGKIALASLPDGGFVVTYDSGNASLASQRFSATGGMIGTPSLLTQAGNTGAVTTALSDGTVLLVSLTGQANVGNLVGQAFTIPPLNLIWTGTGGADLGAGGNWDTQAAPDSSHTTQFALANGGTLTGTAAAASAAFTGTGNWLLNNATLGLVGTLSDQSHVTVNGGGLTASGAASVSALTGAALGVSGGAQVVVRGATIGAGAGESGGVVVTAGTFAVTGLTTLGLNTGGQGALTVSGTGARATGTGAMIVGNAGMGALSVLNGGVVNTNTGAVDAVGAVIGSASGGSGSSVNVSGTGSSWQIGGSLVVGNAGFGQLTLSQGATVTAGGLDEAAAAGGNAAISVVGVNSLLNLTGNLIVGDQSAGGLNILGGGAVVAVNADIGLGAGGTGNIDLEGAGSHLTISGTTVNGVFTGGNLNIGVVGAGVLTLGMGATLSVFNELKVGAHGHIINLGGASDPQTLTAQAGGTIDFAPADFANVVILNDGVFNENNANGTVATPLITHGTTGTGGKIQINTGASLVLNANTVDVGQTIAFADNTGTLVIGQRVVAGNPGTAPTIPLGSLNVLPNFHAAIQNYANVAKLGDQIRFNGLTVGNAVASGNTVTVFDNGGTSQGSLSFITLAGAADPVAAAAAAAQIACYAAGTRIATTRGPASVECIRPGDVVCTVLGGDTAEVIWVGHRTVDCRNHPDPAKVWPVRVSANAFGRGMPAADLMLSPDHAVYVDKVLIPIRLLVNGRTVRQVPVDRITYHHVELDRHDVMLANGMPAESFLDTGNREQFINGGDVVALHPDFSARLWEMNGCAPLVLTGPVLEKARRRLTAEPARRKRRALDTAVPETGSSR